MKNISKFILFIVLGQTEASAFSDRPVDIDDIVKVSQLLNDLNNQLEFFPKNSCDQQYYDETKSEQSICSYSDICSKAKRVDGFIELNGIKIPDYQMHTRLVQLKNTMLNCYDSMGEGDYKDLFRVDARGRNFFLENYLGKEDNKAFQQVYNRTLYQDQLPIGFKRTLSSSDLDTYLNVNSYRLIQDNEMEPLYLSETARRKIQKLHSFLKNPGDINSFRTLRDDLSSKKLRKKISDFYERNRKSKREELLSNIEEKFSMQGFELVDPKQYQAAKNSLKVLELKRKLYNRTFDIKNKIAEKLRSMNMPEKQKSFSLSQVYGAKVFFKDELEDPNCALGTPAYTNGIDFVLCPKAMGLPIETLDIIIAHELTHLFDHCISHYHYQYQKSNLPSYLVKAPAFDKNYFHQWNSCLEKSLTPKVRLNFDPNNVAEKDFEKECTPHNHFRGQSNETFSDVFGRSVLDEDQKSFSKEQAQSYIMGIALAKPFKCEENAQFNQNEYQEFITKTQKVLDSYKCPSLIEVKKYKNSDSHISMEDRVNHIFMSPSIQDALGCKGDEQQKGIQCEF